MVPTPTKTEPRASRSAMGSSAVMAGATAAEVSSDDDDSSTLQQAQERGRRNQGAGGISRALGRAPAALNARSAGLPHPPTCTRASTRANRRTQLLPFQSPRRDSPYGHMVHASEGNGADAASPSPPYPYLGPYPTVSGDWRLTQIQSYFPYLDGRWAVSVSAI